MIGDLAWGTAKVRMPLIEATAPVGVRPDLSGGVDRDLQPYKVRLETVLREAGGGKQEASGLPGGKNRAPDTRAAPRPRCVG